GVVHRLDRLLDEHRAVVGDVQAHAFRQAFVDQDHLLGHGLRQVERVGRGLLGNAYQQTVTAIETRHDAFVGRVDAHVGQVANAHRVPLHVGHDDVAKLFDRLQVGGGHDRELAHFGFDAPRGNHDVLRTQGVLDVLHGKPVGRQLGAIDVDAHRRQALAVDAYFGRPRQYGQPRLDI